MGFLYFKIALLKQNEDPKIVTVTTKLTWVAIFLETLKSEYCTNAIATVDMATMAANGLRPCVQATLFSGLAYLLIVLSVVRVCTLVSRQIEIRGAKNRVCVNCVTSRTPITVAGGSR